MSEATRVRILDSAERLFAAAGLDGPSLREITSAAGVNLAAVNYHFQTRDALIDAVLARRVRPINERRLALLEEALANPGGPVLEQVLEAFLRPVAEAAAQNPDFAPLMGRIHSAPPELIQRMFGAHLAPMAERFEAALRQVRPELATPERFWRLHFTIGALAHALSWTNMLPVMTGGMCDPRDSEVLIEELVRFAAAGFRAAAAQRSSGEPVAAEKERS